MKHINETFFPSMKNTQFSYIIETPNDAVKYRENIRYHAASIIKPIFLDCYIHSPYHIEPQWDKQIEIREDHYCSGSGILNETRSITSITVKDAAEMMISLSDNTASNIIIDQFSDMPEMSTNILSGVMKNLGYKDTDVRAWYGGSHRRSDIGSFKPVDAELYSYDCAGVTSCEDVLKAIKSLYNFDITRSMFENSQDLRGLMKDGVVPDDYIVGHKTGYVDGVRHDAGWIRQKENLLDPTFVVILTDSENHSGKDNWIIIDTIVDIAKSL